MTIIRSMHVRITQISSMRLHEAFSGRVVSRDIIRSKDFRSLHRHEPYAGHQQRQDALIDMLTLAKVKMIYTVGSSFINTIRFFNPAIKIIALTKIEQHHTSKLYFYSSKTILYGKLEQTRLGRNCFHSTWMFPILKIKNRTAD